MAHVCSVILVRRSFDIHHEQQKISLHNESILLLDKNLADDFAFCSLDTRRLDIEELTVCHYLQNIRQLPRNLGLHSKDRLLINQSPPIQLVTAIFDSFNDPRVNSPILSKMLYLSCLSMFSHKKELIPLLFNSISTVSGKVERLKRRTKNAKTFHDKCENFNFRASNETAALTAAFLFIKWDHFG